MCRVHAVRGIFISTPLLSSLWGASIRPLSKTGSFAVKRCSSRLRVGSRSTHRYKRIRSRGLKRSCSGVSYVAQAHIRIVRQIPRPVGIDGTPRMMRGKHCVRPRAVGRPETLPTCVEEGSLQDRQGVMYSTAIARMSMLKGGSDIAARKPLCSTFDELTGASCFVLPVARRLDTLRAGAGSDCR